MWRLFNKLFGWQYAHFLDLHDSHICRMVHINKNMWMGKIIGRAVFVNTDGTMRGGYFLQRYTPLTDELPSAPPTNHTNEE